MLLLALNDTSLFSKRQKNKSTLPAIFIQRKNVPLKVRENRAESNRLAALNAIVYASLLSVAL
jgi:hypothetical protein